MIFYIIASAFLTAVYLTLSSGLMKKLPAASSASLMTVTHLGAGCVLIPVWLLFGQATEQPYWRLEFLWPFFASVVLLVATRRMYYAAYAHCNVVDVAMFSALTPLYTLIAALVLIGELPSPVECAGIALISISIYGYYLVPGDGPRGISVLVRPFLDIRNNPWLKLAFLSTIPPAFASTFQRQALQIGDPLGFICLQLLFIGVLSTLLEARKGDFVEQLQYIKKLPLVRYLLLSLLLAGANACFSFYIAQEKTAIAVALQRTSILFQIVLSYAFLHEKEKVLRGICLCALVAIGYYLTMMD